MNANADYFRAKFPAKDERFIADKLTSVAARHVSIHGGVVGAAVSRDEILAILRILQGGLTR